MTVAGLSLASVLAALCSVSVFASDSAHQLNMMINGTTAWHNDDPSWLRGDLGHYETASKALHFEGHLSYQYTFSPELHVHAHVQAQASAPRTSQDPFGLVELDTRYTYDIDWANSMAFRLGQFFLPTSMENIMPFWDTPYTVSFSALNSWIGEEFRPIGLDSVYRFHADAGQTFSLAATAFAGNDSMGALLAYRGWSAGRVRSSLGEVLELPAIESLTNGGIFSKQRDDGTRPFGKDLDGRPGIALRAGWQQQGNVLQLSYVDNRGDQEIHQGEYAWRTRFALLGGAWQLSEELELLGEAMQGNTRMGQGPAANVDFYAVYAMLSWKPDTMRYSLRLEGFSNEDKDQSPDNNHDLGRRITLASVWQPDSEAWRVAAELAYLKSKRSRIIAQDIQTQGIQTQGNSWFSALMLSYSL